MPAGVVGLDRAKSEGTEVRKGRPVWSLKIMEGRKGSPSWYFATELWIKPGDWT